MGNLCGYVCYQPSRPLHLVFPQVKKGEESVSHAGSTEKNSQNSAMGLNSTLGNALKSHESCQMNI